MTSGEDGGGQGSRRGIGPETDGEAARVQYVEPAGPGQWRLRVWVQPGAKRSEAAGEYQGRLKLRIAAPAVDDKANQALVRFVSGILGLKSGQVSVEKGRTGRGKTLIIQSETEPVWPVGEAG